MLQTFVMSVSSSNAEAFGKSSPVRPATWKSSPIKGDATLKGLRHDPNSKSSQLLQSGDKANVPFIPQGFKATLGWNWPTLSAY